MREVLLATRSAGKLRELQPMMQAAGLQVVTLTGLGIPERPEEAEIEAFETFEENAIAKARYFFGLSGGRPVLADDSGLCVAALGGAPGVRSKRWSGRPDLEGQALDDANNAHLMMMLSGCEDRRATYVCAAAWYDGEHTVVATGASEGRIAEHPEGSMGFGYDPYFISADFGRAFGLVPQREKERVSHRGRAFRALMAELSARR